MKFKYQRGHDGWWTIIKPDGTKVGSFSTRKIAEKYARRFLK